MTMAGYNRVVLIGNLTRDPEYKQLTSGQAVCKLGLATNRQFKNRQTGSMVQEVCYIDIDVWGAQAESCKQYLQKGRPVLIEGRLKFDTWEDPNGQTRNKHTIVADRVVFLGSGGASEVAEDAQPEADPKEKELYDQIAQIKSRQEAAKASASVKGATSVKDEGAVEDKPKRAKKASDAASTGEIAFNDEPPFMDDLPF
jgi:single-strand DNA-binding protein